MTRTRFAHPALLGLVLAVGLVQSSPIGAGELGDLTLVGPEGETFVWPAAEVEEAEAACNTGDAEACYLLGVALAEGESARGYYQRACRGGHAEGCTAADRLARELGAADTREAERGLLASARERCAKGDAEQCWFTGLNHQLGKAGLRKDEAEALEFYVQACDLGNGKGCSSAGTLLTDGEVLPPDLDRAQRLFEAACRAGDSEACRIVGMRDATVQRAMGWIAIQAALAAAFWWLARSFASGRRRFAAITGLLPLAALGFRGATGAGLHAALAVAGIPAALLLLASVIRPAGLASPAVRGFILVALLLAPLSTWLGLGEID